MKIVLENCCIKENKTITIGVTRGSTKMNGGYDYGGYRLKNKFLLNFFCVCLDIR